MSGRWRGTVDAAEPLVRRLKTLPGIDFRGYHFHIGRASQEPGFQQRWATALAYSVLELHRRTGFVPAVLDIGGGWVRERDPESRSLALNNIAVEEYATTACTVLLERLEEVGMTVPELWVEPGRYVVGNAVVLLGTVGASKRDLGLKWVNVDISTNNLPRIDTSGSAYHVLPASDMQRPCTETVTIVGPTCTDSIPSLGLTTAPKCEPSAARHPRPGLHRRARRGHNPWLETGDDEVDRDHAKPWPKREEPLRRSHPEAQWVAP